MFLRYSVVNPLGKEVDTMTMSLKSSEENHKLACVWLREMWRKNLEELPGFRIEVVSWGYEWKERAMA